MADLIKQLRIKTGSLVRLNKDLAMYKKEKKQQKEKIQTLTASGASAGEIRQAEQVLAETMAVLPDTKNRVEKALIDLKSLLEEVDMSPFAADVKKSAEWTKAEEAVKLVEPLFQ